MSKSQNEKRGEKLIVGVTLLFALSPVLVNHGVKSIPPLHFLAYVTLFSIPIFMLTTWKRKEFHQLLDKKAWPHLLGLTLFIAVIPQIMFFWGTQYTSGINTTLLLQSELLFATLIYPFFGEKLTRNKALGALLILVGGGLILFKGGLAFNRGEAVIFISGIFFPFGNVCGKKALQRVSWSVLLLFRMGIGGILLLTLALLWEKGTSPTGAEWALMAGMGLTIWGFQKILWYLAMKHLELTKMTAIIMTAPALSLVFAYFFLAETPDMRQLFGFIATMMGLYFVVKTPSQGSKGILN